MSAFFDMRAVVDSMANETVTVQRDSAGSYTDGWLDTPSRSEFRITASVQPVNGRISEMRSEGQVSQEEIDVYTVCELRPSGLNGVFAPHVSDRFVWGYGTYEVTAVEDWSNQGGYYKARATKVDG